MLLRVYLQIKANYMEKTKFSRFECRFLLIIIQLSYCIPIGIVQFTKFN